MPHPASKTQRAWSQGYEPGSVMSKLSRAEQKRLRELIKRDHQDRKVFERTARLAGWSV